MKEANRIYGGLTMVLATLMIISTIITLAPTIAGTEISELERVVPEIPSYSPSEFELKPTANAFIEPGYSFSSLIEWSEFYAYSKGIIKIWLENTGDNALFVYKYGVQTQGLPGGGWILSDTGLTIYPREKKYIGMTSVYVGGDIDSFSVKQGFNLMAKTGDGRWYDYRTVFVDEPTEISVNSTIAKRESTYQVDRGSMFRQVNKLIFPIDSTVRNIAIQTAKKHPGTYNIYQVCDLFDYAINNIKYVSDPRGFEYMARPGETVSAGGGDCDDQAILLAT